MTKENNNARVRVFFAEIEGDNETIREGLQSIASAVNTTFQTGPTIVRLPPVERVMSDEELFGPIEKQVVDEPKPNSEQDILDSTTPKGETESKKKKSKPPSYTFVKDLNLRPDGKSGLREFYNEKGPKSQQERITVVLYYLYRTLQTPSITCNHLYTAIKEVSVRIPQFLQQTLHNISNRKGWIDASNTDNLKTTVPGDNFVEHDLPHHNGTLPDNGQEE